MTGDRVEKCNEPNKIPTWTDIWPQVVAAIIASSACSQAGISLGLSGVLIPQLAVDKNMVGFDEAAASWIAGLATIWCIIGALGGPLMDKIGRKKTLIACQIPLLISWVIMSTTYYTIWPLYIARSISGIGIGLMGVVLYVYVAEISHSKYRATLIIMISFKSALGVLVVSVIGVSIEWHLASIIFGLIQLINTLALFLIPESPFWIAHFKTSAPEEIQKEIRKLNPPEWLFQEAWGEIQAIDSKRAERTGTMKGEATKEFISVLKDRKTFIPLILLAFVFIFQQGSGVYLFIFYSANILASLGKTTIAGYEVSPEGAVILMGVLRVLTTVATAVLSKKSSKNSIMVYTSLVTSLSAATASIFMALNGVQDVSFESSIDDMPPAANELYSLIAIASLLIFVSAGGMGLLIFPWTLASDLFSTAARAFGNTFSVLFGNVLLFVVVKTFPYWLKIISLPMVFGIHAFSAFAFSTFVWFFLPNTSNKTFEELEQTFAKK